MSQLSNDNTQKKLAAEERSSAQTGEHVQQHSDKGDDNKSTVGNHDSSDEQDGRSDERQATKVVGTATVGTNAAICSSIS